MTIYKKTRMRSNANNYQILTNENEVNMIPDPCNSLVLGRFLFLVA